MIAKLAGAAVDVVAPYIKPALVVGGILLIAACVTLYYRADAASTRAEAAGKALEESERTLSTVRAQHAAAAAVVTVLQDEREKDRQAGRQTIQVINNAPISENRVVPSALPLAIGELQRTAPSEQVRDAGRPAGRAPAMRR